MTDSKTVAVLVSCAVHGDAMIYGGIGAVRCPVAGCIEFRRTECGAFIRRVRPQGHTITCRAPVESETFAYGPQGERVYHGGYCSKHPDKARYAAQGGWRIAHEPKSDRAIELARREECK